MEQIIAEATTMLRMQVSAHCPAGCASHAAVARPLTESFPQYAWLKIGFSCFAFVEPARTCCCMQNEAMLCVKELAERAAAADSHPGLHDRRAETIVAPPESSSSCGGGGGGGASVQAHAPAKADHGVLDLDAPTPSIERTPAAGSVAADDNISTLSAAKSAAKSAGSGGGVGGGDGGGGRGCSRGLFAGSQPAVEGDGSQGNQPQDRAFAEIGDDVDDTMPCQ
jgi:hypothetical protein